jgi:homoserine kinase type II
MNRSDLSSLLLHWPIEPEATFTELPQGTNNHVWLVRTENGSAYVLRLTAFSDLDDLTRLGYEAALLTALRDASLPFALPLLLPTHNGETIVLVKQDQATPVIATLAPFLTGAVPERTAPNIAQAGTALAQLDTALAAIPVDSLPTNADAAHFQYGSLFHCHPLVSDPFATVEQILEPAHATLLCHILRQTQDDWEKLSEQDLPQQILHRDCGPGNMLIDQRRVSAILDFEFAGMDRRIFDLCVALSWWPSRVMGSGREWELIDAFGLAYLTVLPLSEEELRVLPAALRMRDITSLIYRMGRFLAGLETKETILERVQHSLWREAWLVANSETLLQHAMTWPALTRPRDEAVEDLRHCN